MERTVGVIAGLAIAGLGIWGGVGLVRAKHPIVGWLIAMGAGGAGANLIYTGMTGHAMFERTPAVAPTPATAVQ